MNSIQKLPPFIALTIFLVAAPQDTAIAQNPSPASAAPEPPHSYQAENLRQRWYLSGLIVVLLGAGLVYVLKRKHKTA
jgi:hypothetical protein